MKDTKKHLRPREEEIRSWNQLKEFLKDRILLVKEPTMGISMGKAIIAKEAEDGEYIQLPKMEIRASIVMYLYTKPFFDIKVFEDEIVVRGVALRSGEVRIKCLGSISWDEAKRREVPRDSFEDFDVTDKKQAADVQAYLQSLAPGDRVIELGESCMKGIKGTVFKNDDGVQCVRWDMKGDEPGQLSTSITWGTRKLDKIYDRA